MAAAVVCKHYFGEVSSAISAGAGVQVAGVAAALVEVVLVAGAVLEEVLVGVEILVVEALVAVGNRSHRCHG